MELHDKTKAIIRSMRKLGFRPLLIDEMRNLLFIPAQNVPAHQFLLNLCRNLFTLGMSR